MDKQSIIGTKGRINILAVVYARHSSHNQTKQSIEGQVAAAHQYAAAKGYTIIKEYADRAQS
ncbi:MAG: recombinase family protein [Clostridia bacterium]|nr:recombinase family protein [Clostridia bacterium]